MANRAPMDIYDELDMIENKLNELSQGLSSGSNANLISILDQCDRLVNEARQLEKLLMKD